MLGPGQYNWERARDLNVSDNANKRVPKFNLPGDRFKTIEVK